MTDCKMPAGIVYHMSNLVPSWLTSRNSMHTDRHERYKPFHLVQGPTGYQVCDIYFFVTFDAYLKYHCGAGIFSSYGSFSCDVFECASLTISGVRSECLVPSRASGPVFLWQQLRKEFRCCIRSLSDSTRISLVCY